MIRRLSFPFALCLSCFALGCTTDLRPRTVGAVACTSEEEIDIVSQEYGGSRWIANCRGEQYHCERHRRGLTSCVRVE